MGFIKKILAMIVGIKVYYNIGGISLLNKRFRNYLSRQCSQFIRKAISQDLYYDYWRKKNETDRRCVLSKRKETIYIILYKEAQNSTYYRNTLQSISGQTNPNFEIIHISDDILDPEILRSTMRTGSFAIFMESGDILRKNALSKYLNAIGDANYIYSDSDFIDAYGKRHSFESKPDYSKYYLEEYDYIGHSALFSTTYIFEKLNNKSPIDEFVHTLTKESRGKHIPEILYSNIFNPSKDILNRKIEIHINPKVSIIIPNKNRKEILETCIESILEKTTYTNYEIIIIEHDSDQTEVHEYYDNLKKRIKDIKILPYSGYFNFAKMNNLAVREANGEYLLFLNNDTEIITPNWIENLLYWASKDDIGPVGAKLYYPDGTIQHAGVIIGLGQFAGHIMCHRQGNDKGYMNRLVTTQEYMCVTAACLMVSKRKFDLVNGFDENLPSDFNDVDFCLKLYDKNLISIYTPRVELKHYESLSRGKSPAKIAEYNRDVQYMMDRWGKYYRNDPYFNEQLDYEIADFILKL